jgi:antitoxin VapB
MRISLSEDRDIPMPLYIKDDEVDDLANELQRVTGAATKTEAVRAALKDAIERKRDKTAMIEGIRQAQAMARAMGVRRDPDFDMKEFMDELSGGI